MNISIVPLTKERLEEAIDVVLAANLDTREEIEHHLEHIDAHYIALDGNRVVGVIGWYHDIVHWADEAMGDKFPGTNAYWVGFFAVDNAYRGKGVGFALLNRLESELKLKGVKKLWLTSVLETTSYYVRQNFRIMMHADVHGRPRDILVKELS